VIVGPYNEAVCGVHQVNAESKPAA